MTFHHLITLIISCTFKPGTSFPAEGQDTAEDHGSHFSFFFKSGSSICQNTSATLPSIFPLPPLSSPLSIRLNKPRRSSLSSQFQSSLTTTFVWVCGHVAPCQTLNKHTEVNRLGPIFEELPKENAVGFYKFYHQGKKKKAPVLVLLTAGLWLWIQRTACFIRLCKSK